MPPRTRRSCAPRGTTLTCKSWTIEAAYRMLQNNLDPEVAERPDDLVVYGGIGRAARNWECFDQILEALRDLNEDESLLIQSGKPVGRVPHPSGRPARADRQLEPGPALGDLGALQRARSQGPDDVRADDRRLVDLHRLAGHRAGHVRDVLRGRAASTTAAISPADGSSRPGLGGMGGAQPLAGVLAGACVLAVECQERPHRLSPAHALPRPEGHLAR